jgi:hypothetical protein
MGQVAIALFRFRPLLSIRVVLRGQKERNKVEGKPIKCEHLAAFS